MKEKCTDLDFLRGVAQGNPEMILEMLDIYLRETPKFIARMKQAINNEDWELISGASHSFIPSFSIVGINETFTEMTRKISDYAEKKENPDKIKELFLEIEKICLQACEELEQERVLLRRH